MKADSNQTTEQAFIAKKNWKKKKIIIACVVCDSVASGFVISFVSENNFSIFIIIVDRIIVWHEFILL